MLLLLLLRLLLALPLTWRLRALSLWLIRAHDRSGLSSLSNKRPRCWTHVVRPRRRDKLSAACANGKQRTLRLPLLVPVALTSPLLPSVAAAALSRQLQWYCLLLLLLPLLLPPSLCLPPTLTKSRLPLLQLSVRVPVCSTLSVSCRAVRLPSCMC